MGGGLEELSQRSSAIRSYPKNGLKTQNGLATLVKSSGGSSLEFRIRCCLSIRGNGQELWLLFSARFGPSALCRHDGFGPCVPEPSFSRNPKMAPNMSPVLRLGLQNTEGCGIGGWAHSLTETLGGLGLEIHRALASREKKNLNNVGFLVASPSTHPNKSLISTNFGIPFGGHHL